MNSRNNEKTPCRSFICFEPTVRRTLDARATPSTRQQEYKEEVHRRTRRRRHFIKKKKQEEEEEQYSASSCRLAERQLSASNSTFDPVWGALLGPQAFPSIPPTLSGAPLLRLYPEGAPKRRRTYCIPLPSVR